MSAAVLDVPAAKRHRSSDRCRLRRASRQAAIGTLVLGVLTLAVGPRLYPFQAFYVRTGSMSPVIQVGSLVVATGGGRQS